MLPRYEVDNFRFDYGLRGTDAYINFASEYGIDSIEGYFSRGEKFSLAGSISHINIGNIMKLGVNFCDLSSSLESDNQMGYKDHHKIKKFIEKVNELKN